VLWAERGNAERALEWRTNGASTDRTDETETAGSLAQRSARRGQKRFEVVPGEEFCATNGISTRREAIRLFCSSDPRHPRSRSISDRTLPAVVEESFSLDPC